MRAGCPADRSSCPEDNSGADVGPLAVVSADHLPSEPDEKKYDAEVWKRTIGTEFAEYVTIQSNHEFGKHLEDDLDVGYSSRFRPGGL
jgi:hypothetical protein